MIVPVSCPVEIEFVERDVNNAGPATIEFTSTRELTFNVEN